MAPDRLLRSCVLKHLKGWSFRELERELRGNLIYRRFTHLDAEVIPRHDCFRRLFAVLSPEVTQEIHQRVVGLACEPGVAQGRRMQTDTTCDVATLCYTSLCL
jgi:IS5 family transposase